ncbi:hypothetical protein ACWCPQ_17490 [Nocardia sp. NPDC001965]
MNGVGRNITPFHAALLVTADPNRPGYVTSEIIHEYSKPEADTIREAYRTIDEILNKSVFAYLKETLKGFMGAIEADVVDMSEALSQIESSDMGLRSGLRMRTAVLALCSSFHLHQEHNYKQVFLKYGEGSQEHKSVQKIFNRLFEKSAEYRLLYHLRNSLVHYALDIVAIQLGAKEIDGVMRGWTNPTVDISSMLSLNTEISDKYRAQLETLDENPSIIELVTRAMPMLIEADKKVVRILNPNSNDARAQLADFDSKFGDKVGGKSLSSARVDNPMGTFRFEFAVFAENVLAAARNASV